MALNRKYLTLLNTDLDIRQKQFKKLIEKKIALEHRRAMGEPNLEQSEADRKEFEAKSRKYEEQNKRVRRNWLREFLIIMRVI